jgi:hypothetical protein
MKLTVDVSKTVAELTDRLGELAYAQMPFAAALALTRTAQAVQERQVAEMKDVFDRPTPYTLSSTFVRPATKQRLSSEVGLKDFAGKGTPATKFLSPQIAGGGRRLKRFEIALRRTGNLPEDFRIVPGAGCRRDAYGNISAGQIVEILSYFRTFPEAGYRANMTDKRKRQLARGTRSRLGYAYFIGRPGGRAPLGVWQRVQFASGSAVKPVLIFVRGAQYEAVYDFEFVARTTSERVFPAQFEAALQQAVRGQA